VPNAKLYLHETIHIIGTGSEAYKRHTGERTPQGPAGALVGTWQQSGSTGDWPRIVNLWEMDGWAGWGQILEYQYAGTGQPAGLSKWWSEAAKHRSGGFDRILEPAPYCPTREELIRRKVRGRACIQEIATVVPGAADAYLEAVEAHWLPVAESRGLTLVGAWRTAMRDTEAILLWSLPTLADYVRHLSDFARAQETREWSTRARLWRTDYRETLLVPSLWCVLHPEWRERAETPVGAQPARRRSKAPA
jgi:hypothetical protein